jgi:hypothetical protein
MPIPHITNDIQLDTTPGMNPDNKDLSYKLIKAATLQLHEKGIVISVVPPIVMREMHHIAANRAHGTANVRDAHVLALANPAKQMRATKRLAYAKLVRRKLFGAQINVSNAHNICNTAIDPRFFMDVLRTADLNLYLGLHYSRKPGQPFAHRLAALCAWKPLRYMMADPQDYGQLRVLPVGSAEPGPDPALLQLVYHDFTLLAGPGAAHEAIALRQAYLVHGIAMLELVCGNRPNTNRPENVYVEGAGRDMTLYALAKIARARRQGGRRYSAVLTYLAFHGNPPVYPLQSIVQAYGFRRLNVTFARNDALRGGNTQQAIEHFYVLCDTYDAAGNVTETWEERLAHRFPTPELLCPLDTRAVRPQCV